MDMFDALERTYQHAEKVIYNVAADDYDKSTTCPEWDLRTLTNHLIGGVGLFTAMLHGDQPDMSGNHIGEDAAASFRAAADGNLDAWRRPGALDTPADMMPGVKLVELNLTDVLVHSWDIAKSTGQDPSLDDDLTELTLAKVQQWPLETSRSSGAFGPEVAVVDGASSADRLLALTGRDPNS